MSLADAPMSTRQALRASRRITEEAVEAAIVTQRQQLETQLGIMRGALDSDDFDLCSTAAGHVSNIARALHENLEMQSMSRCTVAEASDESLRDELIKRAESKGPDAAGARKAILAAAKCINQPKKEAARGRA